MFKNYFKIAWRNLFRNKVYSIINIAGLALGMAMALLIGLWINDELNINKNFSNYNQIARVMHNAKHNDLVETFDQVPIRLVTEMRNKLGSDIKAIGQLSWVGGNIISYGNTKLGREGGRYADQEMINILSPKMIRGIPNPLGQHSSMMIDQTLAKDIFGKEDPLNKVVKLDNNHTMRITGVFKDFPRTSRFGDTHYFVDWDQFFSDQPYLNTYKDQWDADLAEAYILLQDHTDPDKLGNKIKAMLNGHGRQDNPEVFLHPMSKWHLYGSFKDGKNAGGGIEFVKMFGLIGFFVLLLACINFMNLSTARSERRAREVGIRKAVGSLRLQLIAQFLGESLMITTIAIGISIVLVFFSIPLFNQVADKDIHFPMASPIFWLVLGAFTVITGLIAGSYPAFYLSSFNAVKVLKGTQKAGRFATLPRKVLVVLQFSISIALIIGTLVVYQEIQYARNRPTGYNSKNLITVYRGTEESFLNYDALRNDLISRRIIQDMTVSSSTTNSLSNDVIDGWSWPGKDAKLVAQLATYWISHNYGHTVQWKFREGRDFSSDYLTDSQAVVLNASAVKYMGLKNPVGTTVRFSYADPKKPEFHIIGVIDDMVMQSPFEKVNPTIYMMNVPPRNLTWMTICLNPKISFSKAISQAEGLFKKYIPAAVFDYRINDEQYAKRFVLENRIGTLSFVFAAFAIFISCLGLFGLSSFTAEQRKREIGLRKVLGATLLNLWGLLSKEFLLLVTISFCIALPLSYYLMYNWLLRYSYRVSISVWIFIATIGASLLITLITVSFQSIRASVANPVRSLKAE